MFPNLSQFDVAAIDTETTGLKWFEDKVFGISVSTPDGEDYYWDTRETPKVLDWLRDSLKHSDCPKIVNHHIKFDIHMLLNENIKFNMRNVSCTMIRAALIDEHLIKYDLDGLAKKYLGVGKDSGIYEEMAQVFGGKPTRSSQMKNLHRFDPKRTAVYAKTDTRRALQLWQWQEDEIARQDLYQVVSFEERLFRHIFDMERRGVRVDIAEAEMAMKVLDGRIKYMQKELNTKAGFAINPNPSGSIHKLFNPRFDKKCNMWIASDGTLLNKTSAGKASIDADALARMKHPCAEMILRMRQLIKTKDTFLGGHVIGHAISHGGEYYVHPNINQTKGDNTGGTGTGRLSYTDPALQQIPARNEETASIVRPCFLPDVGQKWSYGDLDQIDFRMFAHYAKVPEILRAYAADPYLDFHQKVADMTGLPRTAKDAHKLGNTSSANAKQMNLAMVFSIGNGHLAEMAGLPWEWDEFEDEEGNIVRYQRGGSEVEEIVENYHAMVPGVREVTKKAKALARSRGLVKTINGRRLRFKRKAECRKAAGLIYQGSAAEVNKELIIRFCEYFESEAPECRVLLNIHDESSFSMMPDRKEAIKHLKELKSLAQNWPNLRVPVNIDFSDIRNNWWDATKADVVTDMRKKI